jgi:hypothetical protein
MEERLWLSCEDPLKLVAWVRRLASNRKLRLFACAFWREWWLAEKDDRVFCLMTHAEQWAEQGGRPELPTPLAFGWHPLVARDAFDAANWTVRQTAGSKSRLDYLRHQPKDRSRATEHQTRLLHDIFGNPFRPLPPLTPTWLQEHDVVVQLARAVYDNRIMPAGTLDPIRLAVLADALEEASALEEAGAAASMLEHLRGPGPHTRGCHVIDILLNKE